MRLVNVMSIAILTPFVTPPVGQGQVARLQAVQERVVLFIPGTTVNLRWVQDAGIDRSALISCEPESSRWAFLCDTIHASDAQELPIQIDLPEVKGNTLSVGQFLPHPVLHLETAGGAVTLSLIPIIPISLESESSESQKARVFLEGNRLRCQFEHANSAQTMHSILWRLQSPSSLPLEMEVETLLVSHLAKFSSVDCTLIWFDGTFFRHSSAHLDAKEIPRPDPDSGPITLSATPTTAPSQLPEEPRNRLPLTPLFVRMSADRSFRFPVEMPQEDREISCRLLDPEAGTCEIEHSEGQISAKGQLRSPAPGKTIAIVEQGSAVHASAQHPVALSVVAGMGEQIFAPTPIPVSLIAETVNRLRCMVPPTFIPKTFVWFRNGHLLQEFLPAVEMDAANSLPVHWTCVTVGWQESGLSGGEAEFVQRPPAPRLDLLPSTLLTLNRTPSTWPFAWTTQSPASLKSSCSIQRENRQKPDAIPCPTQESSPSEGRGRLQLPPLNQTDSPPHGAELWKDVAGLLTLANTENSFPYPFSARIMTPVRRPQILAAMQFPESASVAQCLFVAWDPDGAHLTASLQWLDDPGRVELFSTFPRSGFTLLPRLRDQLKALNSLDPRIRLGKAALPFRQGKASCDVTISDGVLFDRKRASSYPGQAAAIQLLASLSLPPPSGRETQVAKPSHERIAPAVVPTPLPLHLPWPPGSETDLPSWWYDDRPVCSPPCLDDLHTCELHSVWQRLGLQTASNTSPAETACPEAPKP